MDSFFITIDQGSSATKVLAFDHQGQSIYLAFRPLEIERPRPSLRKDETFYPGISSAERTSLLNRWHDVLKTRGILNRISS